MKPSIHPSIHPYCKAETAYLRGEILRRIDSSLEAKHPMRLASELTVLKYVIKYSKVRLSVST